MILGVAFYSMIIGIISAFFSNKDDMQSLVRKKNVTVEEFCKSFSIKDEIKHRLQDSVVYASSKLSYQWLGPGEEIFGELNVQLKYEFLVAIYQNLIIKCLFFSDKNLSFVVRVVPLLKPMQLKSGEVLWEPGDFSTGGRRV